MIKSQLRNSRAWRPDAEKASAPELTGDANLAAESLHQVLDDRQAEAGAAGIA
jgi:hypothetical protein